MPRDLGDVLHYFLPTAEASDDLPPPGTATGPRPLRTLDERPPALPIVALPMAEEDVLRAAFAWNLAVEIARSGASATLLAPESAHSGPWPDPGPGPVGAELRVSPVRDLAELGRAALDIAVQRAADAPEGGVVLVRVPLPWLLEPPGTAALVRWVLLFASPDLSDLLQTYGVAKRAFRLGPETRVGVTIHGARRVHEAERAFGHLAGVTARHLGRSLLSYGLLVDDLHVYRAIVARRPIGLEHPQSRAARALRDVARLVLEDAQMQAVA